MFSHPSVAFQRCLSVPPVLCYKGGNFLPACSGELQCSALLMLLSGFTSKVLCLVLFFISACLGCSVARRVKCLLIIINILFADENNTHLISTLHLSWFPTTVPTIFLTEAGRNILIVAVCGLKTSTKCLHIICRLSQFVY